MFGALGIHIRTQRHDLVAFGFGVLNQMKHQFVSEPLTLKGFGDRRMIGDPQGGRED